MSEIQNRAKSHIPVTFTALQKAPEFGQELLDLKTDIVKEDVFGIEVAEVDEGTYASLILDYVGVRLAIELITPGIDYWMAQASSFSATGQNETKLFADRAQKLKEQRDYLIEKAKASESIVNQLLGETANLKFKKPVVKVGDANEDRLITPNPWDFERPFARPNEEEF